MLENDDLNKFQCNNYDEINLGEIFLSIAQRKWTIIGITLGCILMSGILNFFIIKPTYEATAVISFTSGNNNTESNASVIVTGNDTQYIINRNIISKDLDNIVDIPQIDVDEYISILTGPDILKIALKKIGLNNSSNLNVQVNANIQNDTKDNSEQYRIKLRVNSNNARNCALIANTLISEANVKIDEINANKIKIVYKILDKQIKVIQSELANNMKETSITAENVIEQEQFENKIKGMRAVVDSLALKIIELNTFKSLNAAENRIIILSPAQQSSIPVSPKKALNIILSGILGLMISVLGVFLASFLRKDQI